MGPHVHQEDEMKIGLSIHQQMVLMGILLGVVFFAMFKFFDPIITLLSILGAAVIGLTSFLLMHRKWRAPQ